jgi:alpha-amylase
MKRIQRLTQLFFIFLLTACASAPSPTAAPVILPTDSATATAQPSATATVTLEPTSTTQPTAIPTIASTPVQPVVGLPQGTDSYPWWNDAVFYEIFVRSFYDSNGDGIGDFNGITEKLDYLNDGDPNTTTDLGVTGLWLMPINPSPSYHGYDVTNYYDVNPEYGTMDDFKHLLSEAHKRGIRLTIDWVLNHTSDQHPWFQAALNDKKSPYRNWYIWLDKAPGYQGPWGETVWNYTSSGYYYAVFVNFQPDLNYTNPAVTKEMDKVAAFWLKDVGVDGFRLDAAKHLIEDGSQQQDTPATHTWYKSFRSFYKKINPKAVIIGEVQSNSDIVSTYLKGDELDLGFDFDLANKLITSVQAQSGEAFGDALAHEVTLFQPGQFATFLTNHDQNRTMSTLNDNVSVAKNAAFLLLTSPGVPFLYYGEEIGMLGKKPDENIRLPMQWTSDANAGFTTGTPWRVPGGDYPTKNVAAQSADPNSLFSLYRELIHIRENHAALRVGDFHLIDSGNRSVYASLRISKEEAVLVLTNMSGSPVSDYALKLDSSPLKGAYSINPLMGFGQYQSLQVNDQGGFDNYLPIPEIPAYGRFILQLQVTTP